MYYCTIYMLPGKRLVDKSVFELSLCLSYLDKADAENYKRLLIQQALKNGGSIHSEEGDCTIISGKIVLKTTGIDSNRSNNHYKIIIETEATKFSALSFKSKASVPIYKITDGLAYEVRVEELKKRKAQEVLEKQEEQNYNVEKFASEIKSMKELYPVLRSFVRYSNMKTNKEKLAAVAIKKIQELAK